MSVIQQATRSEDQLTQVIKQVINSWKDRSQAVATFFNKYEDQVYLKEVAPGRNRAVYILGHLASSSDDIFPLFGFGERLYPELQQLFIANPDKTFATIPTVAELKSYWDVINKTLLERFSALTPDEWLDRHTRVSPEDFAVDPLRNRLNVLLSRTNHISYHLGQLNLLHAV
jgi:hypothetical protein